MGLSGKRHEQRNTEVIKYLFSGELIQRYFDLVILFAVLFVSASLMLPAVVHADMQSEIVPPVSGHAANQQSIIPADVLARVNLMSQQLELIRKQLNFPVANVMPVTVSNAQPREVYFQALSAYRRVSRFTFEQLHIFHTETEGIDNAEQDQPYHVWMLVSRSTKQLEQISAEKGIDVQLKEVLQQTEVTPSDVFTALIKINRQLDLMLKAPFSPSDVFQEVTQGIHYAAKLLSIFPVLERIPEAPAYVAGKRPSDVWLLLADCLELVRSISEARDVDILSINVEAFDPNSIRPGDVYQMASIVVAELTYLHRIDADIAAVVPTVKVRDKVPSDVYQRVGLLLKQLRQLEKISSEMIGLRESGI